MLVLQRPEVKQLPREIVLRDGLTLGRSPTFADVQLSDPSAPQLISRNHAIVYYNSSCGDHWAIHDTKSLNGVFVNGKQQFKWNLKEGDIIYFGGESSRIVYRFISSVSAPPILTSQSSASSMMSSTMEDIEEYSVIEERNYPLSFPSEHDVAPLSLHANASTTPVQIASSLLPSAPPVRSLGNIQDKYELKEILGRGSYGIVRLAERKTDNEQFAVKIINQFRISSTKLSSIRDEAGIMSKIDHKNCIKLYEVYERGNHLYLVMELATGGELLERRMESEVEVAALIRSLASALSYLHSHGIVHRDLKPRNIMYASKSPSAEIKIADFGLAFRGEGWITDFCGTPQYVSPEVLEKQPYSQSCDMWSLGVILYLLLCGFLPFYAKNRQRLVANITQCRLDFPSPFWDEVSNSAKNLVSNLLCLDTTKRLTAPQVLEHCFITGEASPLIFPSTNSAGLQAHVGISTLRRTVRMVAFLVRVARQVAKQSPKNFHEQTKSDNPQANKTPNEITDRVVLTVEDVKKRTVECRPATRKKKIQFR